jgi:ferric-dicitrate binding protein FerR (iron transport regulator)
MNQQRVQYLVEQFIINQLTVEEQREFHSLLQNSEHYPGVVAAFEMVSGEVYASNDIDETLVPLLRRAPLADRPERVEEAPVHHISFMRRWGWAAAAVLILLSAGIYFWSSNILVNRRSQLSQVQQQKDVAPGRDGAVLTLSDGSKIVLDSLGNGTIANQNGTDVVLNNGHLKYEAGAEKTNPAQQWNTMFTPKGRQFNVTLPDGTHVWLNAASSITFPTTFTGKERNVQLTGEAYFEVAKNKNMPFKITTPKGAKVEVLGTHFNVNAYDDEEAIRTTLLEGSVKVDIQKQTVLLKPPVHPA